MKALKVVAVLSVILSMSAFSADSSRAAVKPGAVTLSPFAGRYHFEGNQIIQRTPLEDSPMYGLSLGYNIDRRWALEGVLSYIDSEGENRGIDNVDAYAASLDVLYHFRPRQSFVPYLASGLGIISIHPGDGLSDENGLFNLGGGFKYFFNDAVAFRADVRGVLDIDPRDDGRERDLYKSLMYSAGLVFQFGPSEKVPEPLAGDEDQDGVVDPFDRCPGTETGIAVDASGCPQDRDGDGVPNFRDLCPGTPAGAVVDARGCAVDSDGDGIADGLDLCPDTPRGVAVDSQGCSAAASLDTDGDGVDDNADKCPNTPAGMAVNSFGCPRDTDADGVFDFEDACPDTPQGTAVGADGCPLPLQSAPMTLRLEFESGRAEVLPAFVSDLEEASRFIQAHPDSRILIEGHTDSIGSTAANRRLSQARAASVRDYLVTRFDIDSARIDVKGYGEERPVASNATPEGRMQNRRVVITLIPES